MMQVKTNALTAAPVEWLKMVWLCQICVCFMQERQRYPVWEG